MWNGLWRLTMGRWRLVLLEVMCAWKDLILQILPMCLLGVRVAQILTNEPELVQKRVGLMTVQHILLTPKTVVEVHVQHPLSVDC